MYPSTLQRRLTFGSPPAEGGRLKITLAGKERGGGEGGLVFGCKKSARRQRRGGGGFWTTFFTYFFRM